MQLIDHVSISVPNIGKCSNFYDAIMQALNCEKVYGTDDKLGYGTRCTAGDDGHSYIAIYESSTTQPDSARHWCFKTESRKMVSEFYNLGIANGGTCNGAPGVREHYHPNYYGAFVLDPDGNNLEAVFHG